MPEKNNHKELVWNVFRESFNDKKIEVFNVFDHWRFREKLFEAKKAAIKSLKPYGKIKEMEDNNPHLLQVKEAFIKEVKGWLTYFYWSKCEHEIVLTSWPTHITREELDRLNNEPTRRVLTVNLDVERKTDVCEQVMINKDAFFDYLWKNLSLIKKPSEN